MAVRMEIYAEVASCFQGLS